MLNVKKLLTKILNRDIRTVKNTVSIPAIAGGGYTNVSVPAPSTASDEFIIGWRLIAKDAAHQLTMAYTNGWVLNASNEYTGQSSATTAEIWWTIYRKPQ